MIVKATSGSGFLGTLLYVLHGHRDQADNKHARIVGGNMAGASARTLAREFGQLRKLRPTLGKAVSHFSLSFSPGERWLSDDELASIAEDFMNGMGYERAAYVCVRHEDTEHQHVHVVACRATIDARTVADGRSFRRAEAEARRIEIAHRLLRLTPTKEKKVNANEEVKAENHMELVNGHGSCIDVFEMECGEELSPKKARELRRLAQSDDYRQRLIEALGPCFKTINRTTYGLVITTTSGGRIIDRGDRVTAYRMSNEDAAKYLVAIGVAKGWSSISFTGSPEFLRWAFIEAAANGVVVVPKDEEQEKILKSITDEAKREAEAIEARTQSEALAAEAREAASQLLTLHIAATQRRRSEEPPKPLTPTPQLPPLMPPALPLRGSMAARLQAHRDAKATPPEDSRSLRRLGPQ